MFTALRTFLAKLFKSPPFRVATAYTVQHDADQLVTESEAQRVIADPVPYDENLLERARTQWQFGDWDSLAQLGRNTLQHHPDRAKLALLAAVGRLQTGQDGEAKQFVRLAQDWGCSKKLISQLLISGVHNSLGRVALTIGNQARALKHFESSIAIGVPSGDQRLLTQVRVSKQMEQIYLTGINSTINILKNQPILKEKNESPDNSMSCVDHDPVIKSEFNFESVYTEIFSKPEYSAEDHIQYHYVLLKIHELGLSGDFSMLDISSGRGHLIRQAKGLYPNARITSTDIKRYHQENVYGFIECDLSKAKDRNQLRMTGPYDIVICTDVLEHMSKSFVGDVIKIISELSSRSILAIANHSDVWNGHELHIIQEGNQYWESMIRQHFEIIDQLNTYDDRLMLYVLRKVEFKTEVQH